MRAGSVVVNTKPIAQENLAAGNIGTVMKYPYHTAGLGESLPELVLVNWSAGWTGLHWIGEVKEV